MKKTIAFLLTLTMLLSMAFVSSASAAELTNYNTYEIATNELETWSIFRSQGATDLYVLTNCLDGLLTNDTKGALVANAAKEWYSEDAGLTWTFKLNEGMNWCDKDGNIKAEVIANDWVVALEWVLNYAKNESRNTSMPIETIAGAEDYYNYTKELTETEGEEAALALGTEKFLEMVGIETPDDYTIVYHCTAALAYFPSVATTNCLYPLSAKLIEELGGAAGYQEVTWETLWYNGPYTITSFIHQNEKVYTANPNYWNKDNVKLFDTVTVKMVESQEVAYSLFQTGEIDNVTLSQSNLSAIASSPSSEFYDNLVETRIDKFSRSLHFNFFKNNKDGTPDTNWNTAIANEAFRKSWYYGLDWTSYLARVNAINPLSCQNYAYTARAVSVTDDGTDYVDLVLDKLGIQPSNDSYARYDADKAEQYKAQAIEELTAKGVTFPVEIDYYVAASNQTKKDEADVLKQMFSDCLGDDYVVLNICTYISSSSNEVTTPQLQSFVFSGWGADYADPNNFLGQETYGEDNAIYSIYSSNCNDATDPDLIATYEEFTRLVNVARDITDDNDARLEAFAEAEVYMIEHVIALPVSYTINWQLTCVDDYSKIYTAYGIQSERYVNWNTNDQIYTAEEYAALAAE